MKEDSSTLPTYVTGTQVNYYFVCQRKLWLFSHHISMEHTSWGAARYQYENLETLHT